MLVIAASKSSSAACVVEQRSRLGTRGRLGAFSPQQPQREQRRRSDSQGRVSR
jgi:hypothetical protein